jgi:DNA-binding beta-propeller fold protein YncE
MRFYARLGILSALIVFAVGLLSLEAQVVTATVAAAAEPRYTIVNSSTNKVYVLGDCVQGCAYNQAGTVTVIDGNTLSEQTVNVSYKPVGIAANFTTNKIYVAGCTDNYCSNPGVLTVIDGNTLSTQSVSIGHNPAALTVNSTTNKIYVACTGSVTVIDGATLATQSVTARNIPTAIAVNQTTNKIYAVYSEYSSYGVVFVIDGNTLATQRVVVGFLPVSVVVDATTNKIFVANQCGQSSYGCGRGTVTAIDGRTLASYETYVGYRPGPIGVNTSTHTVFVANQCGSYNNCSGQGSVYGIDETTYSYSGVTVGINPQDLEVDAVSNRVYVSNFYACPTCYGTSTVTAVDWARLTAFPVAVGTSPSQMAFNPQTDQLYVPNAVDNTVSVIGGHAKLKFVSVTPCRLVDTRNSGPIQGGTSQTFNVPQLGGCNIPNSAAAYALNVTVVPHGNLSYLTLWPSGPRVPQISTMNSLDGRVKANAATIAAGLNAAVSVYVTDTTDVILDINGYYTPASQQSYQFYPLTPCRLVDTRNANGDLGGPYLHGAQERDFPVNQSACLPHNVTIKAYSLNITAIPHPAGQQLGYLTVWSAGDSRPTVSTLNNPTATYVANAALVPAGANGGIAVYPDQNTDVAIDVNGYFAAPGQGGLSLYPASLCRVIDTRSYPYYQPFSGQMAIGVLGSNCSVANASQAYVFNATVVPSPSLGYLTLWADRGTQPVVSTLNAPDGAVTSNMAIVPNLDGMTDAYAAGTTHLILDLYGFFAP